MSLFKRSSVPTPGTASTVGRSPIWSPPKFSLRQYALIVGGLLILAGGVFIFASGSLATPTNTNNTIIGLINATKLGSSTANSIKSAGIKWTRIEDGTPSSPDGTNPSVADAEADGFKVELIIGNTSDSTPLSGVNQATWLTSTLNEIKAYENDPNVQLFEVMNEPYLKGGANNGDAATYGKMYLSLYNAAKSAGLTHTKLLFNMYGDYKKGCSSCWSQDANNGGWLRDAVTANPGLAQAITANAFAAHPYGCKTTPTTCQNNADDYNTAAVAAEEQVAQKVLGTIPDFYLTEIGFSINACGANGCANPNVPDQATQASALDDDFSVYLPDIHVKGIWVYTINDDGAGNFGVFNGPNSPRPAFSQVMAPIASSGSGGGGDTTPPTVSMTAPAAGSTVSGIVPVSANAADNVGVTSVQFKLDGNFIGSPDTSGPYGYSWDTTTTSNGTHTLTAVASDTAGNSATAAIITVTVSNKDTTAPSTPAALTATAPTSAAVNLSWKASTDNVGVTGYKIYRNGSGTALATINSPTLTYTDATVSASTSYTYTVAAFDAAGNQSSQSAAATVTTPAAADKTPPSVPTGLAGHATSQTSIALSWNPSTDTGGSGLAGYHLYRNGNLIASPTDSSYTDSGLTAGTSYTYSVSAYDKAANGSAASGSITVTTQVTPPDTQAPSTPAALTATAPTSAAVNLSWKASTDNVGVTGYKIYRNGSGTALTTVGASATSYVDAAVSAGTQYSYTVTAIDAAGNESAKSTAANVTTPAATDKTPPSVPTGLAGHATSQISIALSWNASTDTGGSGLAGYHLYRNGNLIASPSGTSYTDTNLSPGTTYTYSVSAYDNAANGSVASSSVSISTPSGGPTSVQNFHWNASTRSLSWSAYPGAAAYKIATVHNPTTTRNTNYLYPPVTGTGYMPPSLAGETVHYGIIPETKNSDGSYSDEVGATWAAEVTVTWSNNVQNFQWNATTKSLSWSAYPGADAYKIATVHNPTTVRNTNYTYPPITGTSFIPPVLSGETVHYGIIPEKKNSNGTFSDEAGATWASEITVTWSKPWWQL